MEFENLQSYFIDKISKELSENKQRVFIDRLVSLGIDIDLEEQQNKRFKDICITYQNNEETYYYNDGSDNGLRIITFTEINSSPKIDFKTGKVSVESEISYY